MKELEKKLVEEFVNKNKFIFKILSKEEIEKECEDISLCQEIQRWIFNYGYVRKRVKFNFKLKLVCSLVVCEEFFILFVDGLLEIQDII